MTWEEFWEFIDDWWSEAPEEARLHRSEYCSDTFDPAEHEDDAYAFTELLEDLQPSWEQRLQKLDREELLSLDRLIETALYKIDRQDVHEALDGSDDGFLYARGFVVAMGQPYYGNVEREPLRYGVMEAECEWFCFETRVQYEDRFGEMPDSGISRETGSNAEGWGDA